MSSERSRILGKLRLLGLYAFVGLLAWYSRPTPSLFLSGAVLVLVGEAVRIWAAGHLVKSLELIDSGPYAYTQNPLYLGRLLILTGICIICRSRYALNWLALLLGYVVFFAYYLPRKLRVEGARLRKMHGESWVRYQTSVPVLIPSLSRFPGQTTPWSLRKAIRNQEYLVLAGLLSVLAFLARRTWSP